jgi:hypothetical protein
MKEYKRWYDYDPTLLEVIELLRYYPNELHSQAVVFLEKITVQAGEDTVERFYNMVRPKDGGHRWYDKDPVISKAIELLRVVPVNVQKEVAQNFMKALNDMGITKEQISANQAKNSV